MVDDKNETADTRGDAPGAEMNFDIWFSGFAWDFETKFLFRLIVFINDS